MTRDNLIAVYLDWVNNYVAIERYAEHNGLHVDEANILIKLARDVFNSRHPDA